MNWRWFEKVSVRLDFMNKHTDPRKLTERVFWTLRYSKLRIIQWLERKCRIRSCSTLFIYNRILNRNSYCVSHQVALSKFERQSLARMGLTLRTMPPDHSYMSIDKHAFGHGSVLTVKSRKENICTIPSFYRGQKLLSLFSEILLEHRYQGLKKRLQLSSRALHAII